MYVELAVAAVSVGLQMLIPKPVRTRTKAQIPTIPQAEPSTALPEVYGTTRVAGHFFYSTAPRKVVNTTTVGKGAPQQVRDESILVDLIGYALSCNEPVNLVELNLNGETVYSRDSLNTSIRNKSDSFLEDHLVFFPGTDDQPASADLINEEGTANISRFKRMSYILLKNLNLGDYGNNYPTVSVVLESRNNYPNLQVFFNKIFEKSKVNEGSFNQFNVNILTASNRLADIPFLGGAFMLDGGDYYSWISSLIEFWQLSVVESNNGVFTLDVPADIYGALNSVTTIDAHEVLGQAGQEQFKISDVSLDVIPNQLTVNFADRNLDFDQNSATVNIDKKGGLTNAATFDLPFSMSRGNAMSGAMRLLRGSWTKKKTLTFSCPSQFDVFLRLGKIIKFTNNDTLEGSYWIIQNVTLGENGFLEVLAQVINPGTWAYASNISSTPKSDIPTGGNGNLSPNITIGDTSLVTTDNSDRVSPYFSLSSPNFTGTANIYISDDDVTYSFLRNASATGFGAKLTTALSSSPPFVPDYIDVLTLQLLDPSKSLTSVSFNDFLQGARILAVNKELIAYQTATQIAPDTWELRGLLRGAFDTEYFIQPHAANSDALIIKELNYTSPRLALDLADRGSLYFKASTASNPDLSSITAFYVDFEANASKALAPVVLKPKKNVNGDWTISWIPRSANRANFIIEDNVSRSGNPDGNTFDVLIYSETLVLLRTSTVTANTLTYTNAEQISDAGMSLSKIFVTIFQQSLQTSSGRGYESVNV